MRIYIAILSIVLSAGFLNVSFADTTNNNAAILLYKTQLYQELDSGNILDGDFDKQTEINIADTQLKLAQSYMTAGNRKLAIILGILARKTMQRAVGNPYDPAMVPIYSILVQLYDSQIDTDIPNKNQADAVKSKMYREAIDHIHAL